MYGDSLPHPLDCTYTMGNQILEVWVKCDACKKGKKLLKIGELGTLQNRYFNLALLRKQVWILGTEGGSVK